MSRISTYAIDGTPTVNDKLIGTDVDNVDVTMNYTIGDIISLVPGGGGVGISSINTATGPAITLSGTGGLVVTQVGNNIFLDTSTVGSSGVTDINSITGSVDLQGKGGLVVTEIGGTIFLDTTNSGNFNSLTTVGSSGAATLTGGVLNIPNYAGGVSGVSDVNSVTGSVDLQGKGGLVVTEVGNTIFLDVAGVGGSVNSLTTTGNQGAATLTGGVLNIPNYAVGGGGSVTSVNAGINGDAITITGGPITSNGVLNFAFTGDKSQYVRGDGTLLAFPATTSGTVQEITSSNTSFISATGTSPITTTGDLSFSLNAIGTPSATTYLRGDNSWATIPGGGGTVTDFSAVVNGGITDAISLRVFDSTTTPRLELDFQGVAGQYINGLGVLTFFPSLGMSSWTIGDGTGIEPVTDGVEVQFRGLDKISTSVALVGTDIQLDINHDNTVRLDTVSAVSPAAGGTFTVVDSVTQDATGHPTSVNVKTVTLPSSGSAINYTFYEARYSTISNTVNVNVLENTTGRNFSWQRDVVNGTIDISMTPSIGVPDVLIFCNGNGGDKGAKTQVFYESFDNANQIVLSTVDIATGADSSSDIDDGMFSIKIWTKV